MRPRHWLALGGVIAVALGTGWLTRRPLTEAAIRVYLAQKGVAAAYTVAKADSRHLVFDKVALGPPGKRDFTARRISVDLAWLGWGPRVVAVRLEAPVVRARLLATGLSFGSLDRLIPATKSDQFPATMVIITDGSVSVATPLGQVLAMVNAAGRLDTDFRAVVQTAPVTLQSVTLQSATLQSAACNGRIGPARLVVTTTLHDFAVSGAGLAENLTCAAVDVPRVQWAFQLAAPITLASLSATATLAAAAGRAGPLRFSAPSTLRLTGAGTLAHLRGDWQFAIAKPAALRESAQYIAGAGRLDWRRGAAIQIAGKVRAAGLASGTVQAALSVAGLPDLAPDLAAGLASRLAAAARSGAADAQFTAALGGAAHIMITSAEVRGASGARLQFVGAPGARWSADGAAVDGRITLGGAGLPSGAVTLAGVAVGPDAWTGVATMTVQPWRSDAGALAVPVAALRLANGVADLSGRAIVSTRVGGVAVEGLDMRLAVRARRDGQRLVFGPGCAAIAATSVRTAALAVGRVALRLCPASRASAPTLSGQRLAGTMAVSAIHVQGAASGQDFAVDSQPAQLSFGGSLDRPSVQSPRLAVRLQSGDRLGNIVAAGRLTAGGLIAGRDSAGRASAGRDSGTATGWSGSGHISADADLPAVQIRHGTAQWRLAAGALTLAKVGGQLTDPSPVPRFAPLQIRDAGVRVTAARLTGQAMIGLVDGQSPLAVVHGDYAFGAGTGTARLDSTLAFSKDLQPLQISELARGFVANVDGKVVSHADLTLGPDGWRGTATVRIKALSLATAALGPVTGIEGSLYFDDLPRVHTAPSQELRIASINPGVLVEGGVARVQIIDAGAIAIEDMRWPFAGGRLILQPVVFQAGAAQRRYVLAVEDLDAGQFLQRFDLNNLNATGQFDGVLPLVFAGTTGRIVGGRLTAQPAGGMIQYVGEVGQASMGAGARLAFDALRSMRYHALTLALDGDLDGELVTAINFAGTNLTPVKLGGSLPLQSSGMPFKFGITVRAPFRSLLGTMASFSDARSLLRAAPAGTAAPPKP
jgi:hypothetical protein